MALFASFFLNLKKITGQKNLAFAVSFLFLIAFLFPACVRAEDDPFQFENTHWKSFARYKEETKPGGVAAPETTENDAPSTSAPAANDMHDVNGDAASTITPPAMTPEVAAPTRPLNIPVMPGMNKGYDVRVNSTEDEKPPVAQITHIETQPTVSIPDKNWQTPKDAARRTSSGDDEDGGDEHQPLDVRMSFLPNTQITPVPSPEYNSTHGRKAPAAVAAAPEVPPEKKAADLAACAAVDAYKKKQLEAIESDRQTLTALQKAIAQLGLQKELSFMAGANGNVNQADSTSAAKMDMPPSLAAPAKN